MFDNVYTDLLKKLTSSQESVLLTYMKANNEKSGSILNKLLLNKERIESEFSSNNLNNDLYEKILHTLESGNIQLFKNKNEETILIEPYFPKPRLLIFGGGHIAKPLAQFGEKVGFSVTVIDDRPSFANPTRFPEASQVICESFENCFNMLNPSKSDFVVIVTRGHRHDGVCLRQALNYDLAYLGMIGSKRRVKCIKDELINEGYTMTQLNKVNAPIGLDIGAVTPDEIAISIISQVISFRRQRGNMRDSKSNTTFNYPEYDQIVIEELAKQVDTPKALVTIILAKGSVPRKSGAKMIVWSDGRTLGSIGGGCSEANVAAIARDVILSKGYTIEHVDMTGDVAEEEGMVCGGIIDVLIESL